MELLPLLFWRGLGGVWINKTDRYRERTSSLPAGSQAILLLRGKGIMFVPKTNMKRLFSYKNDVLLLLAASVLYFVVRLPNLHLLPIFTDEAIYMRWAQIALHDASWRFISLTDGKQPLFIWLTIVAMKFIHDPLIAGRLVSVGSGFLTIIGLYILTMELFKKRSIACITVLLYIFYPMAHVHDRMAIYDSLVTTFFVWCAYVSILLAKYVRLDLAYTLGFAIGAATLNKTSGFLSAYILPLTLIFFDFKKKKWQEQFFRWCIYAFIAYVISQVFYNILRLSPYFHIITEKDAIFVYPVREWIHHPFTFFFGNLRGLTTWLIEYMTIPYVVLVIISLIFWKDFMREKLFLFLYFLAPFTALSLFGRVLFPRYIFFMSAMLLPLASWSIVFFSQWISKKYKFSGNVSLIVLTVLAIVYPAYVSLMFSVDPVHAPIPKADSRQYVNGWTDGWGVREAVSYFKDQAKDKKIYIGTEGTFGLMPFSLELYLVDNPNITLKGIWPIESTPPESLLKAASEMPTYVVFYQPCVNCGQHNEAPKSWSVTEVKRIQQGSADSYFIIYQLNGQDTH